MIELVVIGLVLWVVVAALLFYPVSEWSSQWHWSLQVVAFILSFPAILFVVTVVRWVMDDLLPRTGLRERSP